MKDNERISDLDLDWSLHSIDLLIYIMDQKKIMLQIVLCVTQDSFCLRVKVEESIIKRQDAFNLDG